MHNSEEINMKEVCANYNKAASLYKNGWRIENKEDIIKKYGSGVFNFLKHFENYNNNYNSMK